MLSIEQKFSESGEHIFHIWNAGVRRWHCHPNPIMQNLGDNTNSHTARMARLAVEYFRNTKYSRDSDFIRDILIMILYHDVHESIIGDMPGHIRNSYGLGNSTIHELKAVEQKIADESMEKLTEDMVSETTNTSSQPDQTSVHYMVMKFFDKLDAVLTLTRMGIVYDESFSDIIEFSEKIDQMVDDAHFTDKTKEVIEACRNAIE